MSEQRRDNLQEQKCKRHSRVTLMVFCVILFMIASSVGVLTYWWLGGPLEQARQTLPKGEDASYVMDPPDKLNIVIMGVDLRPQDGDPGRSDTLFVMTIDAKSREVSTISIPRDTRVRIKGLGWDKINHAFSIGEAPLTQQTVENLLGISIDYYVKVDMESFVRVVDAIGGITVDVDKRMQYEDTWEHFVIDLYPGLQHLNGKAALQYVRYRDEEGDIGRVARQQKFIRAVMSEVMSPKIVLKAPGIIREVFSALDTNIPAPLMVGLAWHLKDGLSAGLKANMVEGLPYYINGVSYWIPDIMRMRQKVAEIQGIPFSGSVQVAAQSLADEYSMNLPTYAHLDDGGNYYGMGDKPLDKPKAAATTNPKSTALPSSSSDVTPKAPMPNKSTPASQNKDGVSVKKTEPRRI